MVTHVCLQENEREKSLNWNLCDKQNSSEWDFLCMCATMFFVLYKDKELLEYFASFAADEGESRGNVFNIIKVE